MANKPKQQGTARETDVVNRHNAIPVVEAHRDENNSNLSDVVVRTRAGRIRTEVKDRINLNAHKLMKKMGELYPDDLNVLWWHRTSKKNGNTRKSPDGPDLVHVTGDDWLKIVETIDRIGAAAREADVFMSTQEAVALIDWVAEALPHQLRGDA